MSDTKTFENSLTEGSVFKTLLKFGLPMVGTYLLVSLYSLADMIILGHFAGTVSVAGVSTSAQIVDLMLEMGLGLLTGPTVLIGQAIGAGNREKMKNTLRTTIAMSFIFVIVITAIMMIFKNPILRIAQTPAEALGEADAYYTICLGGYIFVFLYNAVASILRGMGDSKKPLYFALIATIINVLADLALVGGFHMGAAGAAIATVGAQAISLIISIIYLSRTDFPVPLNLSSFKIHKEELSEILKIGIPAALQNSFLSFSLVFLIVVANMLGVVQAGTVGIGAKINVILILPIIAMANALSAMVAQNRGAGKEDRVMEATKKCFYIVGLYALVACFIMWQFPEFLFGIFSEDPAVLAMARDYLHGHCWDYMIVMPMAYCLGSLFVGVGKTSYVAVSNVVGALISRIPISYIMAIMLSMGVWGIGVAYPISTAVTNFCYIMFFFFGKWRMKDDLPQYGDGEVSEQAQ